MTGLFNAMLLNSAVAALLAAVVWAVSHVPAIRRRPGLRHALWLIVLMKLVTPPLFELSILPHWPVAEETARDKHRSFSLAAPVIAPTSGSVERSQEAARNAGGMINWTLILMAASGLGTVSVVTLAAWRIFRLDRVLRRGESRDVRIASIVGTCALRMNLATVPKICIVSANVAPLLWVCRRAPLIAIPRRLVDQLSDEQLACVVAHEIAHYIRRDHWTNWLSLLVAAICWWNPVAWWVRHELRMAQESCCDAMVIHQSIATRRTYAEVLFHVLEFLQARSPLSVELASTFGTRSSTERRFAMIANARVNHRLAWWNYLLVLAALAVIPWLPKGAGGQPAQANAVDAMVTMRYAIHDLPVWRLEESSWVFDASVVQTVVANAAGKDAWGEGTELTVTEDEVGLVVRQTKQNQEKIAAAMKDLYAEQGIAARRFGRVPTEKTKREPTVDDRDEIGKATTQTYSVAELVGSPLKSDAAAAEIDLLILDLKKAVLPRTWNTAGGNAMAEPYPPDSAIVVFHDRDGHAQVTEYLANKKRIRKANAEQQGE